MEDLLGVRDRAALLIGVGAGIGRATALALGRAGCRLALADVDVPQAKTVAEELRGLGPAPRVIGVDVRDRDAAVGAVARAAHDLGGLDVLVNIVGASTWAPVVEVREEDWDRDFLLNLKQHFAICQAAGRQMIAQGRGGAIATVASLSGLFAAPRHAAYGAAKAGLVAFTKTLAEEWLEHRIRVNTVAPGAVRTPRFEELVASGVTKPDAATLARLTEPEDVAGAILFLCSDLSRGVSGHTLVVDGGSSTANPFGL